MTEDKEPEIDPTANVVALTEAANKRQDDLRSLNDKRLDSEIAHLKEISELRSAFDRETRSLESNRLNAIRQVDVLAVNTAADRAAAAIQALAAVTTTNADVLRNALNSTATTIATQTAGTVSAITERIAALEKSSYEGIGKGRVADPMLAEMVTELKGLRESRSNVAGKSQGIMATWGILLGVAALIASLIAIGTFVFSNRSATGVNPEVVYLPAPVTTPR